MSVRDAGPIAVTGATGYIGARLVPRLLEAGWSRAGVATADVAAQTQDFDQTVFSVEVYENGSAR